MASISKPLGTDKNGKKIYMVSWREPGGKQRHKRVHGYEEAKRFKAEIEQRLLSGNYVPINNKTLGEYILEWIEEQKDAKRYKTWIDYELIAVKHIMPHLGHIKLRELKPYHIREYLKYKLQEGRLDGKPGGLDLETVRKHRRILHLILECAFEDELIETNPVDRVKMSKIVPASYEDEGREKIALTRDQVVELLQLVEHTDLHLIVPIAIFTGLRLGEILGLRWENVDLNARIIEVKKALQRQKKDNISKLVLDETKSKSSRVKPVPIPKILATMLRRERKAQLERKLAFGKAYYDNDLVCCQANGKPWEPSNISKKFRKLVDKSDLPHITFHDLRHTFLTLLAEELKIGLNTVSELARHADPGFTARTYIHPAMELRFQAIDAYEAYIMGVGSGQQKENQLSPAGQR